MPGQRTSSVSPIRTSPLRHQDKSVSEHTASRSARLRHARHTGQGEGQGHQGQTPQDQAVGQGLASQLQGIIRDELRRIMEVQHRSVLAMMGALDQVGGAYPGADPAPQAVAPPLLSAKPASSSQRGRLAHPQRQQGQGQTLGGDDTENLEDESVAEMVSLKEEIVAHTSVKTQHARPREIQQRSGHVRGALSELHNLQAQTEQPQQRQSSYAEEISSRAGRLFSHQTGPASRDGSVHFPLLAWGDQQQQQQQHVPPGPLPLLHLDPTQHSGADDPFRNLRRFLPQVPPPQPSSYTTPASFSQHSSSAFPQQAPPIHQGPPLFPFSGQYQAPPPPPPPPPPHYDLSNLPLLSAPPPAQFPHAPLPSSSSPAGPFPLLRILPPGGASEHEMQRTKIEETRQRLLHKFQLQVLQDKENHDHEEMAHRLLRLEGHDEADRISEKMDSARSEKSKGSDKLPSEKLPSEREELPEPERAASAQSGGLDTTLTEGGQTGSAAEVSINDGYALPRGIFESYLQLGEHLIGPEAGQTSAAFQLKMAQAMQRQVEKRITRPKVDFSTMTQEQVDASMATDPALEVVRTAEAATSITKDTGVDPIEEALRDYDLRRHNNVVPPDIFMGLRFADQDGQAGVTPGGPSDEPSKGRSYLNVVDIRASAVLRDIPDRPKGKTTEKESEEEMEGHVNLGSAMLASQRAALQMGALEESLREKFAPQTGSGPGAKGHDSLTVKMFDQLQAGKENRMSVAVIPRSSMSEPKTAMLRRLQDMSDQMRAIDDMSQNIEREFKSSHLLLNTLQDVNASIERTRSPSPARPKGSPARHKELRYSLEDKTEEYDEEFEEEHEAGSARTLPTPKSSAKSPLASARSGRSGRSARSKSSLASRSASELTELLTEVLAEQGVDMESAGYSRELAHQLEKDAREQMARQDALAQSREKLEHISRAQEHQLESRTREEREDLKRWMAEKFHQRQGEYKKRRQELIERESKPFKSSSVATRQNLHKLAEERNERRQHMAADFMNQRLNEAEHLMGSIIVDRPEMPSWGALATGDISGVPVSQSASRSTFAGRSGPRKSRSPPRRAGPLSHRPQFSSRSPSDTRLTREAPPTATTIVKGILKPSATSTTLAGGEHGAAARLSSSDLHLGNLASLSAEGLSVDSSADIVNYARRILEMEGGSGEMPRGDSYEISTSPPPPRRRQPGQQPPARFIPPQARQQAPTKSFAAMVRLQRPAATRKWQEVTKQRQLQATAAHERSAAGAAARQGGRMSGAPAGQKTWTMHDPNLGNGKAKEYGSKKIPGSSPRPQASDGGSARRVKTYAGRLQEMKPSSRMYSPPASRGRPHSARTMSSGTTRSAAAQPRGPSHRPQTYVEQLRTLSSRGGGSAAHRGKGKVPVKMRTFLRSRGPAHQPKTYTEQLRELNPHPQSDTASVSTRRRPMQASATASSVGVGSRATSRHRPYGDPYSEVDYEELASVLSDWDMDENVKNIIYGGSTVASSVAFRDDIDTSMSAGDMRRGGPAPSEGQSDYFDVIMQGDGPYRSVEDEDLGMLGVGDYRSSVDIREIEQIADAASVGSGSVLSVIDWDAVNDLIKDV